MSLLRCVQHVLPIGHDMWDMVAQLHAINYAHCQRDGKSIKKKYLRLANEKPGTGNPTMPEATRLAKEIKLAIDLKVGNTNPDANDFFQKDAASEDSPADIPVQITAATAPTIDSGTAITTTATATNLSSTTKRGTRTNQIVTAMRSNGDDNRASVTSLMEQHLQAEAAELRLRRLEREAAEEQRRLDREDHHRRREEEREERRLEREEERRAREDAEERCRRDREEEKSHQQQQILNMVQVLMTGAMAFMGMKHRDNNSNGNS